MNDKLKSILSKHVKLTGRKCPLHKCDTYYDERGKERCGRCDIVRDKKDAEKFRESQADPERLKNYYEEKKPKSKRNNLDGSAGDIIKKVMGGTK